jgi:hypothetical protein
MKRRITIILLAISIISLVVSCASTNQSYSKYTGSDDKEIGLNYLKDMKYEIIEELGFAEEVLAKKEDLIKQQYQRIWGLQKVEPLDYVGKTIKVYGYTVKNHPLDNIEGNNKKQTNIWIMIEDGKMIGGYSFPDNEHLRGSLYSLEGKTLEEVTKMDFQTWREKWVEKYK